MLRDAGVSSLDEPSVPSFFVSRAEDSYYVEIHPTPPFTAAGEHNTCVFLFARPLVSLMAIETRIDYGHGGVLARQVCLSRRRARRNCRGQNAP